MHDPAPTAVYIRVSSPKGQKTDSQRAELEAWLKRHKLKSVQWFEDRDSATNMEREAFQKLQAAVFAGKVQTVVVWKLDRLARNLKEGVNVLADWCKRGVRVVAITQQIDLSGPVGNLIASLLFGIAEIELQHSKERQAIGITPACANAARQTNNKLASAVFTKSARVVSFVSYSPLKNPSRTI